MRFDGPGVIDTGVIVSALFLRDSVPARAFHRAVEIGPPIASEATIAELFDVLHRPKLARYIPATLRDDFLQSFVSTLRIVEPAAHVRVCRDRNDDKFLDAAIAGKAAFLITGDQDLLSLDPFRGVRIVTPKEFLRLAPDG